MRSVLAVIALVAGLGLVTPGAATAAAPSSDTASAHSVAHRHACTRTSSGTCIRGGEFCRQSQYGHSGWDAVGRRYVCKGSHTHPHWMVP
ncbi:hypothetical protein D9V37_03260 [Nocardioides mangrovicus]|uniref:DUF3761 domain-containing protein n=1 Tax=Nocardioides mangrovicus TaxID=2478913 RepID=A0A3L8P833_9ACTN|nr:hypothetical protein [Nocardioides mangrovicus]RLV50963.1 hypothetical protein D9V37_03260 [Nocardioides mangrovicus]